MNLSKTSEYAIRILGHMAAGEAKIHTAKQMVEQLQIPDKYLRRIMTNLSKAGLIRSIQGREGGYRFAIAPDRIFLMDIIKAVDEESKYTGCVLGFAHCSDENPCLVHDKWAEGRAKILEIFTSISLTEFAEEARAFKTKQTI
ncbi:MAG: transcriptional regulator [Bacteroidetes bacterium]|nr:MAG: transcriptional regulator [Bacteroidota bacterium]